MTRAAQIVAAAALLVACGPALDQLGSSPNDYNDYRRTRSAESLEQKLRASHEYLERHRDGRWHAEVERWFTRTEPGYYSEARESIPRLELYLETLPRGPHAAAAAQRITELQLDKRFQRQRDAAITEEARELEEKLDRADKLRRAFVAAFSDWLGRISELRAIGQPTSALGHQFLYPWRLSKPAARCNGNLCRKSLSFPYAIPDSGRLSPREALFDVVVVLSNGVVERVELTGPELFSRLGEAVQLTPIRPGDAQARAEAIGRAVQLSELALERGMPKSRCGQAAVAERVVTRRCDGVQLEVRVAADSGDEDRVTLSAAPP